MSNYDDGDGSDHGNWASEGDEADFCPELLDLYQSDNSDYILSSTDGKDRGDGRGGWNARSLNQQIDLEEMKIRLRGGF